MAAAKARGPDGPEGQRAERKRERAAALASALNASGGGGGRDGASNGGDAKRPKRDDNAGTAGTGSKHAHGECKRATWALHALAKAPTDAASIANAAKALAHHKSIAAVDALLASVALWSAAKLRAGADGGAEWGADTAVRRELTRAASGVASRVSDLADAFDARGVSNALWALATLHSVPGGVDADAGHAATKALIKALNGTLKDACNARDAANALWGCAKMRCGLSPETVKVLSSPYVSTHPTSARRPWRCGRSRRCVRTERSRMDPREPPRLTWRVHCRTKSVNGKKERLTRE